MFEEGSLSRRRVGVAALGWNVDAPERRHPHWFLQPFTTLPPSPSSPLSFNWPRRSRDPPLASPTGIPQGIVLESSWKLLLFALDSPIIFFFRQINDQSTRLKTRVQFSRFRRFQLFERFSFLFFFLEKKCVRIDGWKKRKWMGGAKPPRKMRNYYRPIRVIRSSRGECCLILVTRVAAYRAKLQKGEKFSSTSFFNGLWWIAGGRVLPKLLGDE